MSTLKAEGTTFAMTVADYPVKQRCAHCCENIKKTVSVRVT
jgi:hypothetical protein